MEKRWKVASIRGIPIYITVPWLAFAAFVVYVTYEGLSRGGTLTDQQALWWSVVNAILFYGSIILHELAHAATARVFDLPVHGITLVFWGGYTETHSGERGPLTSFLISAAGPFSTLVLAGVFGVGYASTDGVLSEILGNLAVLSLLFAGLNALPGFPVDGGRMLLAIVWGITKDRFLALRVAGWGGVVVGGVLGVIGIQRLRANDSDWLIFAFIGWMMISQGLQVGKQSPILQDLSRGIVSEAMGPAPPPISADVTLLHALETHLRADRVTEFPVVDGVRPPDRVAVVLEGGEGRRERPDPRGPDGDDAAGADAGGTTGPAPRSSDRMDRRRRSSAGRRWRPGRRSALDRRHRQLVPAPAHGRDGAERRGAGPPTTRPRRCRRLAVASAS